MRVSDLGEFGLIERLAELAESSRGERSGLIISIGDDAAAWQCSSPVQLATVDSLIENVHFTLDTATWEEVGWKSLAVNLSDIAAMGGKPEYALVSLGLPGNTDADDVLNLYWGMISLAEQYQVFIVGGDTVDAPQLVVNITVLGSATSPDALLTRSAARPGDQIAVTGSLGAAAAGVEMFNRDLDFSPDIEDTLVRALLRPSPRVAEGQLLVKHGVKAAIDISDGLLADMKHICEQSRVGALIDADRVPVTPSVEASFGERALGMAMTGGEDYELLFTASADVIKRVIAEVSTPIHVIGEVVADENHRVILIDSRGETWDMQVAGWDHFREAKRQR